MKTLTIMKSIIWMLTFLFFFIVVVSETMKGQDGLKSIQNTESLDNLLKFCKSAVTFFKSKRPSIDRLSASGMFPVGFNLKRVALNFPLAIDD